MKYQTIVADPPWSYRNKRTGGSMKSGSAAKYPTMTVEEICALPIKEIAAKDCCLFLWATTPLLPEAFQVMKAWEFKYKTAIYWRKTGRLGLGYWWRGQLSMIFGLAHLKALTFPRIPNKTSSSCPRQHSQKPEEFFNLIEPLIPSPWIELFARDRRPGWDAWGNEVENDIELEDHEQH